MSEYEIIRILIRHYCMNKVSTSSKNLSEKLVASNKSAFENYSDVDYLPGFMEWENLIDREELEKLDAELFAEEMG